MALNISRLREDFPILRSTAKGKPLVYFDSACMALKPKQVVVAMEEYYNSFPACVGRSLHKLGKAATDAYWRARERIADFIGSRADEVIFTRNTTEGINLVARSLPLAKGDVVLTTDKEHNSNLLPWQLMAKERGIRHVVVKSNDDGTFDMENFERALREHKPKLVSMVHASNIDGYTVPAKEIIKQAHDAKSLVMLDAAQSAPHMPLDAKKLGVDFLAFSGHKMLGPTGTGVLFVKRDLADTLGQFMIGGETVVNSTYTSYELEKPPMRFEAGLQNYAGAIGLAAAADYLSKVGLQNVQEHEEDLTRTMAKGLAEIPNLSIIGPEDPELRGGITSFNIKGMDPGTAAVMLDELANIAIRSGHHCAHSWFNAHGMPRGCARASLYLYNTEEEVATFVEALKKVAKMAK